MARPIESALADMLDAVEDVEVLIKGVTLAAYNKDFKTRLAVERCIEIISEAARSIPAACKNASRYFLEGNTRGRQRPSP